jgi:hypothetical protein
MRVTSLIIINQSTVFFMKWYEHHAAEFHSIFIISSFVSNNINTVAVQTYEVGSPLDIGS